MNSIHLMLSTGSEFRGHPFQEGKSVEEFLQYLSSRAKTKYSSGDSGVVGHRKNCALHRLSK